MRRLSAQYVITNSGPLLSKPVITIEDDGTIISINKTGEKITETIPVEFYDGIIIPGFINCHCHLELSHMKGLVKSGTGLGQFIEQIRNTRASTTEKTENAASSADNDMFNEGTVLCADICNGSVSFGVKAKSSIRYINLLEVFGIDPERASRRMEELETVAEEAASAGLPYFRVPHALYSMSLSLLRLLREKSNDNKVTSIHFMETAAESQFLKYHSGPIMESYERSGLITSLPETAENHADAILNEITRSGNLLVVHNTFADRSTIRKSMKRGNIFWCLCPNSNLYIEGTLPPVDLLVDEGCTIVIGTDSLASNNRISIIEEIKTLQSYFPEVPLEKFILWATLNGARALGEEEVYGMIEPGKKPGLVLLKDLDLSGMKLLPGTSSIRLV
jgi:aminodeoxyfutalosine deaminase